MVPLAECWFVVVAIEWQMSEIHETDGGIRKHILPRRSRQLVFILQLIRYKIALFVFLPV